MIVFKITFNIAEGGFSFGSDTKHVGHRLLYLRAFVIQFLQKEWWHFEHETGDLTIDSQIWHFNTSIYGFIKSILDTDFSFNL